MTVQKLHAGLPPVNLVSPRFKKGDIPMWKLSPVQAEGRSDIAHKIDTGIYQCVSRRCAVCDSDHFEIIAQRDRYGLPVTTVICCECGLLMTNPVMRETDYHDFYKTSYWNLYAFEDYCADSFFRAQGFSGDRIRRNLNGTFDIEDKIIAEVGCATGGILYALRPYCAQVVGCDYAEKNLAKGREAGLDLRFGGLDAVRDAKPDIIIYNHVMEHIYDPHAELRKALEILPEGGLVYLEVPGLFNIRNAYKGDFLFYLQNAHLFHFTSDTLRTVLEQVGFKVIYGDEMAVLIGAKVSGHAKGLPDLSMNYKKTMRFLRQSERRRWLYRLKRDPKQLLLAALNSVGIDRWMLTIYRAMRGRRAPT
jgi:SAM-dependent methyltransferase